MNTIGLIREIYPKEIELMRTWRNHPSIRLNMYSRNEIRITQHLKWWQKIQSRLDCIYLMYELNSNPMGVIAFTEIDNINKNASWAFYSSPDAPKGTGSKMEFLALDYAFSELGLYKLYCEVLSFNSTVIKLHQKFGFCIEGCFREQHKVGESFIDIYRLGIFSHEWNSIKPNIAKRIEKIK
jgi:UDP-4-amino-4,6-dideoxy-N-acetyl-beta-L-altrosamine N-acetyltransferase